METLFERSVSDASKLSSLTDDDYALFRRVDEACNELLVPEFEKYMERKFNDKVPQVLKKHNLMGVPIATKYGGSGARPLVHALTLERFGQLGLGVVTFVDVHQALGSLTLQEWGSEELKQKYLTKAATGEVILAYALTEPEAGSDPASLKTQFRKEGSNYYLNGSKYLISNGSVANRLIVFAYPEGQTKGMTAFLVDAKETGFLRRHETRGEDWPVHFRHCHALLRGPQGPEGGHDRGRGSGARHRVLGAPQRKAGYRIRLDRGDGGLPEPGEGAGIFEDTARKAHREASTNPAAHREDSLEPRVLEVAGVPRRAKERGVQQRQGRPQR